MSMVLSLLDFTNLSRLLVYSVREPLAHVSLRVVSRFLQVICLAGVIFLCEEFH